MTKSTLTRHSQAGLTLVELLVVLMVMALMTGMTWRGLDGVLRAYEHMQQRQQHTQILHWSVRQWTYDWTEAAATGMQNTMAFDGQTLRLVRRLAHDGQGVGRHSLVVVAWRVAPNAQEITHWMRWESAPLNNVNDLQQQWALAAQWGQGLAQPLHSQARQLAPVQAMQLQFWEGTAWANALTTRTDAQSLPPAVRLSLTVPGPHQLTLDWVQPSTVEPKVF